MMPLTKLFSVTRQVAQKGHTIDEIRSWENRGMKMLNDFVDTDNFGIGVGSGCRLPISHSKND
jgi:hypothetical protein